MDDTTIIAFSDFSTVVMSEIFSRADLNGQGVKIMVHELTNTGRVRSIKVKVGGGIWSLPFQIYA